MANDMVNTESRCTTLSKQASCFLKQSNALTTAAYSLTRNEKRLLYIVVEILTSQKIPEIRGRYDIEIHHSHYAAIFSGSTNVARDINEASRLLNTREVIFYLPEENGDGDSEDDIALDGLSWTVKRSIRPKQGLTRLSLNAEVVDLMLETKQFTGFYMRDVARLNKVTSMRLYESLMQWHDRNKRKEQQVTFGFEWIMNRYQLPNSMRVLTDFRKRFLKVTTKEITENTDINVKYVENTVRQGRKVVLESVTFYWSKKPTAKKTNVKPEPKQRLSKPNALKIPDEESSNKSEFVLDGMRYMGSLMAGHNVPMPTATWFTKYAEAHAEIMGDYPSEAVYSFVSTNMLQ
ncbi:RepB family plasmid replication initiator protein [Photobacterium damselae]|uniref:RepB family plasmid replication initiator protein n=2 Tax=Photobacterium damselae subsp. damselae TaxID=85581 RepID=A0AAD3ZWX9_PHODD|nr:RepB family plasmid replication initiator protein [Photobacterium damselae]KAB1185684.1 RepB family plasmid replication initiator protein [Photobacterium damselae subsp. damselae]MBE8127634.1 RepB family plasmid replication initiator protein [Photobacterium damselae subsp. piscicida]MCG3826510.1 RepB family plasmid replication initiator protein [Photobacterium damselae]PSB85322.1 hypothetical protein C5F64_12550 [Photobacterium damselae subsp. damselae]WIH21905.1 RepB family plasmid replica